MKVRFIDWCIKNCIISYIDDLGGFFISSAFVGVGVSWFGNPFADCFSFGC